MDFLNPHRADAAAGSTAHATMRRFDQAKPAQRLQNMDHRQQRAKNAKEAFLKEHTRQHSPSNDQ
jgi:hypothetical protein